MEWIKTSQSNLNELAAKWIYGRVQYYLSSCGRVALGVSGGSSPLEMLEILFSHFSQLEAKNLFVFQVDERFVSPDNPNSNQIKIGSRIPSHIKDRFFPIDILSNIEETQWAYEKKLSLFGSGLDIVLLGLGTDGHAASLFSDENLRLKGRLCITQCSNYHRVGFTSDYILKAKEIVFFVPGSDKKSIIDEFMCPESNIVARHIPNHHSQVTFFSGQD